MKILVFGAGVLGCNLARNLCRAGKDVTLLARGKWAEEIKQNGLRIKNQLLPFPSVTHIPVVTELSPDAAYDVIFVVVRYTQLENLLEPLRKSRGVFADFPLLNLAIIFPFAISFLFSHEHVSDI